MGDACSFLFSKDGSLGVGVTMTKSGLFSVLWIFFPLPPAEDMFCLRSPNEVSPKWAISEANSTKLRIRE